MTRIFGHYVALEMFVLWLFEFLPCFLVLYLLLAEAAVPGSGAASGIGAGWVDLVAADHAALLVLACLASLAVAAAVGIDLGRLLDHGLMRPLQILAAWIVFLFTTRLVFSL